MSTSDPASAHLRWLKQAEHWGEWIRFEEVAGQAERVWLMKSSGGPDARFYARGRGQIGQQHAHVLAATCWAFANGFLPVEAYECDDAMFLALAARADVLAGGALADRHAS